MTKNNTFTVGDDECGRVGRYEIHDAISGELIGFAENILGTNAVAAYLNQSGPSLGRFTNRFEAGAAVYNAWKASK